MFKDFKMLEMEGCASSVFEGETNPFIRDIHDLCNLVLESETTNCLNLLLGTLTTRGLYGAGLADSDTAHLMYRVSGGFVNFIFSGSRVIIYAIPDSKEDGRNRSLSWLEVDSALVSQLIDTVSGAVLEEGIFIAQDGYTYVTKSFKIDVLG
jgi:hypothetical protein